MGLFKLMTKLQRKSRAHLIQTTHQTTSQSDLISTDTNIASTAMLRPATAQNLDFSNSYCDAFATMAKNSADGLTASSPTDKDNENAHSIAAPLNTPIHNGDSILMNLSVIATNLPDIPAPTRRLCSAPYNPNGYRMSRFYEHLHLDDVYEKRGRRSRSVPAEMIRSENPMTAPIRSVERWTFPKPTDVERKDSKHKRSKSYPGYR